MKRDGAGTPAEHETSTGDRPAGRSSDTVADTQADERSGLVSFRRSWEHAPAAVAVVTGPAHTLVYANSAFRRLGAAERPEEPGASVSPGIGASAADALPPTHAGAVVALLDAARRTGTAVRSTVSIASVGAADPWHCTAWPLASASEASDAPMARAEAAHAVEPGALVVCIDAHLHAERAHARQRELTELVLLSALREEDRADAADLARSGAERESAVRARSLAEMSHEIRTPLTAIGGYTELMAMGVLGPLTERQREALARIDDAVRHLVGLASAQLDRAQLEAGRVGYTIADVSVDEALAAVVALLAPQAAAKGVALAVRPGWQGLVVRGDGARLRQVVLNLLANGLKYTLPGGAVWCEAMPLEVDDAGARVAIRVVDTGSGIAAADLEHVFDPYVQVGRRPDGREGGVGLGLAISRELARGMGGDLTVESVLGQGSTFTLLMPRA